MVVGGAAKGNIPDRPLFFAVETLFDTGGLTNAIAQIVQLGATDFTATDDFDVGNTGGVQQENPLYAYPLEGATDGDGLVDTTVAHSDDGAFVGLNPLFTALLDHDADANGIANVDGGEIALELLFFNGANNCLGVHDVSKNHRRP